MSAKITSCDIANVFISVSKRTLKKHEILHLTSIAQKVFLEEEKENLFIDPINKNNVPTILEDHLYNKDNNEVIENLIMRDEDNTTPYNADIDTKRLTFVIATYYNYFYSKTEQNLEKIAA